MPKDPQILKEVKQREKAKRKKLLVKIAISSVLLVLVLLLGLVISRTTWVDVKHVEVRTADNSDLVNADRELLTAVVEDKVIGANLFSVDIREVRKILLESNPFIKDVYVEKHFPNRVVATLTEREPYLLVDTTNNCYLLDTEGYVLAKTTGEEEIEVEPQLDCMTMKEKFPVVIVYSTDVKADFPLGEQSTFYEAVKISIFSKVLKDNGYILENVELVEGIFLLQVGVDKLIVFSDSQDLDIQLKRFLLVTDKIEEEGLTFRTLDLRYKRPILKKI
ncbi:MAG: FtsQ-type POTRA domain-containing protein [Candidatus Dojkabacteria bacterium]|nr:MAG: FtsQ-type POTRA domain-containing protein [Candidatus Dojkabacteria bacterium]